MHCPGGNATDPIWRVLASPDGISFWTTLKPLHSNPLANQLLCIDFLTPPTPLITPHKLPALLEFLMPLKNWCSIHARWSKAVWSIPYVSVAFFSSFKKEFYLHIVHPHVQIAFLKLTCCDNQDFVGYIPIPAASVHLNMKS